MFVFSSVVWSKGLFEYIDTCILKKWMTECLASVLCPRAFIAIQFYCFFCCCFLACKPTFKVNDMKTSTKRPYTACTVNWKSPISSKSNLIWNYIISALFSNSYSIIMYKCQEAVLCLRKFCFVTFWILFTTAKVVGSNAVVYCHQHLYIQSGWGNNYLIHC